MANNITVQQHHEADWCEWGGHRMKMQRVYMIEPASWICRECIAKALKRSNADREGKTDDNN